MNTKYVFLYQTLFYYVIAVQFIDVATTFVLISRYGIAGEMNLLVRFLLEKSYFFGWVILILLKIFFMTIFYKVYKYGSTYCVKLPKLTFDGLGFISVFYFVVIVGNFVGVMIL